MPITNLLKQLSQNLRLGTLLSPPVPLTGGALHTMWVFTTDRREYVAKQINPYIVTKPSFPQSYECSEAIAAEFNRNGIPAVSALNVDHRYVHPIQDQWFIVYPKVEGRIININDLKMIHAAQIGEIFANLHKLNISIKGVDKSHYDQFSDEHWEDLIVQAGYEKLKNLIPVIHKWNAAYANAIPILNENLVITHRDLHHNNVLWHEDKPWVIDWECAGLMNPTMEIVGYGLEWGGIISNHSINKPILEGLLNAYHADGNIRSTRTPIEFAFYGWLGHCALGWTEFNLRRTLGIISKDDDEIKLGKEILEAKMIPTLNYLSEYDRSLISYLTDKLD